MKNSFSHSYLPYLREMQLILAQRGGKDALVDYVLLRAYSDEAETYPYIAAIIAENRRPLPPEMMSAVTARPLDKLKRSLLILTSFRLIERDEDDSYRFAG